MAQIPGRESNVVDPKSARAALQPEIDKARRNVQAGEEAVKRSEGDEYRLKENQARLQHARRMLFALESAEKAMASVCCDEFIQNCELQEYL
jgi:hypothetical protein